MLRREAEADDPEIAFVETDPDGFAWEGTLEPPVMLEEWVPFVPGEDPWDRVGADMPEWVMAPGTDESDEAEAVPVRRPTKRKG